MKILLSPYTKIVICYNPILIYNSKLCSNIYIYIFLFTSLSHTWAVPNMEVGHCNTCVVGRGSKAWSFICDGRLGLWCCSGRWPIWRCEDWSQVAGCGWENWGLGGVENFFFLNIFNMMYHKRTCKL